MNKIIQRRPVLNHIELPNTLHPVLKRIFSARQVNAATALDYSLQNLHPYTTLSGIEEAVTLLYEALVKQSRILVVADYDADGATSCAVAVKALRQMGAQYVGFLVPNREKHGYGLMPPIVELALPYQPDLLITVDNGISSVTGVDAAKQYGMQVLITDHHSPPLELPKADAIVNPNQRGDQFPSKNLAGVGVIFYVMLALRARLREQGWFTAKAIQIPNLADLLDLVALGTVADMVQLDYNNRILVEQGLKRLRANYCCPGIRALLRVAGREQSHLAASDLSFAVAPCLNAAGRMNDMSYGIACLLSEDDATALQYAQLLSTFNQKRRAVEADMQREALDMLDTMVLHDGVDLPLGLCLFDENWHQGVIGILASRIKDRINRPVFVFTDGGNGELRGSGRSVAGVHIRDILANIMVQSPDIFTRFGGHAMAAGLSLQRHYFDTFQQLFDTEVRKYLAVDSLHGIIHSDGELTASDFTLELAEQLRTIAPWGQGFPEPMFDGEFEIIDRRRLKDKHLKMQVRSVAGGLPMPAIAFNTEIPTHLHRVHLAYKLEVNTYRGAKNIQLTAEYVATDSERVPVNNEFSNHSIKC